MGLGGKFNYHQTRCNPRWMKNSATFLILKKSDKGKRFYA